MIHVLTLILGQGHFDGYYSGIEVHRLYFLVTSWSLLCLGSTL